jgi:hypothetical protein
MMGLNLDGGNQMKDWVNWLVIGGGDEMINNTNVIKESKKIIKDALKPEKFKLRDLLKGMKQVENNEVEDSYGKRYWKGEDGSLRRIR